MATKLYVELVCALCAYLVVATGWVFFGWSTLALFLAWMFIQRLFVAWINFSSGVVLSILCLMAARRA